MTDSNLQPDAAYAWSAQSRVYHRPRCRWAWRIRAANLRTGTREDAVATGRRECRACRAAGAADAQGAAA